MASQVHASRVLGVLVYLGITSALTQRVGAGEPPVTIIRGPYLQALLSTSADVVWSTRRPAECRVRFQPEGMEAPLETVSHRRMNHLVKLDGLAPGGRHRYEVLDGNGDPVDGGGPFEFRTAPRPGEGSFRWVALGDSGTGSGKQLEIAAALCDLAPPPDLFIHTGDLIYVGNADDAIFSPYRCLLSKTCLYPARGNHDLGLVWNNLFFPPIESDGATSSNYSFDWGDAHFATVDTALLGGQPGAEQVAWLKKDLEAALAAGSRWIILYTHVPVYSGGVYRNVGAQVLAPIADEFRVDLVLSGHDHNYQRTHPVRQHIARDAWQHPDYVSPRGTIYIVTGGGGAGLYPGGVKYPNRVFVSQHHALDVDVTPERISVKARGCAGGDAICLGDEGILDAFTITKGAGPPRPLRFRRGDMDFDGVVNVGDAIALLRHLFGGVALQCPAVGEADLSGVLDLADPITILNHLFLGGPALPHPYPDCGEAIVEDDEFCLECVTP